MSEGRGISNAPGSPAQVPGVPENFLPIIFEVFETLDTKTERPGIRSEDMAYCDGFMPLGPNNLRALPGIGPAIFELGDARTVIWYAFGNISDTQYIVILLSDGQLLAQNLDTSAQIEILPPGGIAAPSTIMGFSQWGSQYLIFGKDQTNGYWLWDGTSTFGAGTLSPEVTLINSGSDYTSSPTVALQTSGAGTGYGFNAQIDSGSVIRVLVTNPGSGFARDDIVSVTFSGGGSDDQAIAVATLSAGGGVTGVVVLNGGSGYTFNAVLSFTGGSGSGAAGILNVQNGTIVSVTMLNPGTGYTSPPTPVVTDPGYGSGAAHIAGGSGASGYATVGSNGIASIAVSSGGSGYTSVPEVVILGDGQNAQATANVSGGVVTSVDVRDPGSGYTKALVDIRGGNNAANATVSLMPFGLSGTAIETYVSRVWFTNGGAAATFPPKNRTIFTAPGSPVNTDPSLGAGAFQSNDSFLQVGYHALRQTNGFLYLIGDSSLNSISGVQSSSSGTPPQTTTTFSNQNADPQIGSPWPSSVQQFRRNIVLANTLGIYISLGGAVNKVSDPLDGFYASNPGIFAVGQNFPAAVAQIFGRYVYMLLLPVIDPFTGVAATKLLMTDGKRWWTSQQQVALTYIANQKINSILTAYGTDGKKIYPLFHTPTTSFTKRVRSKLWATPGYYTTKTTLHALGIVRYYAADAALTLHADNESAASATISIAPPAAPGLSVFGPEPIGQAGRLSGITLETNASDITVMSLMLVDQIYSTNV